MSIFGEPGTYGEAENKRLFVAMMRTLQTVHSDLELLALELHIANRLKWAELVDKNMNTLANDIFPEFNVLEELVNSKIKRIDAAIKEAKEKGDKK